jgi:DNA polymerase/3'-5' exonuclease PolX
MGVCQLDGGIHRRIDIKYYPISEFAYALMHFTGSDMFNRAIRLVAHQQGYRLSDHSMVPLDSDDKNKGKKNIVCYTEADIFKFLGLDYKAPKDRNS